jgi:hypothetical protein
VSSDQNLPSDIRAQVSIASNDVRQDRENRLTRRALNASDGETAKANPNVMGVAGEATTFVAGRLWWS